MNSTRCNCPACFFEPVTFKPFYGVFKDQIINGAQIYYTDRDKVNLCNLAVQILYQMYHAPGTKMFRTSADGDSGPDAFDHIAGGDALRLALQSGKTPEEIITSWQPGLTPFGRRGGPICFTARSPRRCWQLIKPKNQSN